MQLDFAYVLLLEMSRQAFAAGQFGVSQRLLEAAASCAEAMADEARLDEVAALAQRRRAWLEERAPAARCLAGAG
jgi:hypothetical protein